MSAAAELVVAGSLDTLATEANELHALANTAAESAVEYAWQCGQKLIDAKAQLQHGEWLPWLEANFKATRFMAAKYMKLAANVERVTHLPESERPQSIRQALRQLAVPEKGDKKDVIPFTGEYEWYTPPEYTALARVVMGGIDLDPASCEEANANVGAETYYTQEENGLDESKEWAGRVFLNPPYCQPQIADFTDRLLAELHHGAVTEAIMLTNNSSDAGWFQEAAAVADAICLTRGRISFINGGESSSPLRGQAFFYFGPNAAKFAQEYASIGIVVRAIDAA